MPVKPKVEEKYFKIFGEYPPGYMTKADSIDAGLLPEATQKSVSIDRIRAGIGDRMDSLNAELLKIPTPSSRSEFGIPPWWMSPEAKGTPEAQAVAKKATAVYFKTKSEPKPPPDEAGALLDEIDKDMKRIRNHIGADEETTLQDIEAEIKESSWANDPSMIMLIDRIKKNTAKLSKMQPDTTNNEPRMSLHPQPTSENNKPGITREQAIQELRRRGKLK